MLAVRTLSGAVIVHFPGSERQAAADGWRRHAARMQAQRFTESLIVEAAVIPPGGPWQRLLLGLLLAAQIAIALNPSTGMLRTFRPGRAEPTTARARAPRRGRDGPFDWMPR